jgi:hypothetical protein
VQNKTIFVQMYVSSYLLKALCVSVLIFAIIAPSSCDATAIAIANATGAASPSAYAADGGESAKSIAMFLNGVAHTINYTGTDTPQGLATAFCSSQTVEFRNDENVKSCVRKLTNELGLRMRVRPVPKVRSIVVEIAGSDYAFDYEVGKPIDENAAGLSSHWCNLPAALAVAAGNAASSNSTECQRALFATMKTHLESARQEELRLAANSAFPHLPIPFVMTVNEADYTFEYPTGMQIDTAASQLSMQFCEGRSEIMRVSNDECVSQLTTAMRARLYELDAMPVPWDHHMAWMEEASSYHTPNTMRLLQENVRQKLLPAQGGEWSSSPIDPVIIVQFKSSTNQWVDQFEFRDSRLPNAGRGVYALRNFTQNEAVTRYIGRVVSELRPYSQYSLSLKLPGRNPVIMDSSIEHAGEHPQHYAFAHYINHASIKSDRNCMFTMSGHVRATRNIVKGEQLLSSYSQVLDALQEGLFHSRARV